MNRFTIRKVAVLGAGVMGAQIAAHCANAGVPVLLYDLPAKEGPANGIVIGALERLRKLSPAPLGTAARVGYIEPANYDQDLGRLQECDLIIEAIAERMDWKHALYARVAPHVAAHAVFASNTSGLPIAKLAEGLPTELRERFCGVHFFNPPRYMHLVELIGTAQTRAELLDTLETFLTTTLGKGVVRALDTPNFVANRVGVFNILSTMAQAERFGLGFDVVDDLTGSKLGRAKSGTFRTADVVGLDTLVHVIRTLQEQLPEDPFAACYATPSVLAKLVEQGALGQKAGAGFYRKKGREIQRLDPKAGDYVPSGEKADPLIGRMLKAPLPLRLKLLREARHPQARFLWSILRDGFHYIAVHLAEIANTARDVDFALRWGFGHAQGPFELWQQAGWLQVARWIEEDIAAGETLSRAPLPAWVTQGPVAERGGVHQPEGSWNARTGQFEARAALPVHERQIFNAPLVGETQRTWLTAGATVFEDDAIRVWTVDRVGLDDVLVASFKTKMHVISPGVTAGLMRAVALAESEYRGLVVWQGEEPFSAGADLQAMLPLFMSGGVAAIEPEEERLQQLMLRLRYARVPTVAALAGLVLGGGCELAVHCARRVAYLESYIGLVEVGVGLVPGAGGLTYGARRAAEEQRVAPDLPLLGFLKKYALAAATAQVSKSALEAREIGYLLDSDPVVYNAHELLYVAIRQAQAMHDAGWAPPMKARFAVAGRDGAATLKAQLVNMREGGYISEHDERLGSQIAEVLCGGDVDPGTEVDEAWILRLERKAFMRLLRNPKTQERILGMMNTGKPVRN